jgi:hypothetical protein
MIYGNALKLRPLKSTVGRDLSFTTVGKVALQNSNGNTPLRRQLLPEAGAQALALREAVEVEFFVG